MDTGNYVALSVGGIFVFTALMVVFFGLSGVAALGWMDASHGMRYVERTKTVIFVAVLVLFGVIDMLIIRNFNDPGSSAHALQLVLRRVDVIAGLVAGVISLWVMRQYSSLLDL